MAPSPRIRPVPPIYPVHDSPAWSSTADTFRIRPVAGCEPLSLWTRLVEVLSSTCRPCWTVPPSSRWCPTEAATATATALPSGPNWRAMLGGSILSGTSVSWSMRETVSPVAFNDVRAASVEPLTPAGAATGRSAGGGRADGGTPRCLATGRDFAPPNRLRSRPDRERNATHVEPGAQRQACHRGPRLGTVGKTRYRCRRQRGSIHS